jgi:hypothetical protein
MVRQKKKTKKKRVTKRSQVKYPGLTPRFFSRIKQEYHDYDYINQLSEKEKQWLNDFTEEDLGARLNHKGKKINRTKERKRGCYNRNNARNRDIYAISKATGTLDSWEDYKAENVDNSTYDIEADIIERLDEDKLSEDPSDPREQT